MKHATTVILAGLLVLGSGTALTKTKAGPVVVKRGTMTDKRNGTIYNTVTIGRQKWMAENLDYPLGSSWCYEGKAENCEKYGRLYAWNAALKACPSGWHLPSDGEWQVLEDALEGDAKGLKVAKGWNGTDRYGFSVQPAGSRGGNGSFGRLGSGAYFWSATEYAAQIAWYRYFRSGVGSVSSNCGYKTDGFSVRCLEN
ncbi:MAG: hypothetical protein RL318_380 [Fibrobacterota bacterium]|jgi:uncharacterized protein (TIGR02145 family)